MAAQLIARHKDRILSILLTVEPPGFTDCTSIVTYKQPAAAPYYIHARCLPVSAEVQRPLVVLGQCQVHEEAAYVGVGLEKRVQMTNTSLIPTHFTWRQLV